MYGQEIKAEAGNEQYFKELERLSKKAPNRGLYPVTVDPKINETLADLATYSSSQEILINLVSMLGIKPPNPPEGMLVGGIRCVWMGDDDTGYPGIAVWNIYDPNDEEPPYDKDGNPILDQP